MMNMNILEVVTPLSIYHKGSLTLGADIPPDTPLPVKEHNQISPVPLIHTNHEHLVLDH